MNFEAMCPSDHSASLWLALCQGSHGGSRACVKETAANESTL